MPDSDDSDATVARLLDAHGTTFGDELGIRLASGTPSPLFRWLTAWILSAAPIRHGEAVRAARALSKAGWRTAKAMAAPSWEERAHVLNQNGYARYDERTSRILKDMADEFIDGYRGDLRRLRDAAGREPDAERRLLKELKGMGDTAVDIFCREVPLIWDELFPFADDLALRAAARNGLPDSAQGLARLVPRERFPTLVVALARDELEQ